MTDFPPEAGEVLTTLARRAISEHLGHEVPEVPEGIDWLQAPAASFVTLTEKGRLRGCIGSLEARRPLAEDVRSNAVAAAFRDPRFMPLDADQLAGVRVEVSVLGEPVELSVTDEQDAAEQLRPGVDGVILQVGDKRATFLPQVWSQISHPVEFLDHLKRKAGVRFNYWGPDVRLWRYQVTAFHEGGPGAPEEE